MSGKGQHTNITVRDVAQGPALSGEGTASHQSIPMVVQNDGQGPTGLPNKPADEKSSGEEPNGGGSALHDSQPNLNAIDPAYGFPGPSAKVWTTDSMSAAVHKYDTERIKNVKDDIGTLLIFAGLFSAVLTAFLIDFYKALQAERSRALVAINTLWFLSLIISLTTSSLAILVAGWMRGFQSDLPFTQSPELFFRVRQFQLQRVNRFRLFEIPKILPYLIQLSLLFFFVGLLIFLFTLDTTIAAIATACVGLWGFIFTTATLLKNTSLGGDTSPF